MARITISEASRRGYGARMTLYRAIKSGSITPHLDGKKRLLDVSDLNRIFGKPGSIGPADNGEGTDHGNLKSQNDLLLEDVARLERELATAKRETAEERDHGRKREDELLDMNKATANR